MSSASFRRPLVQRKNEPANPARPRCADPPTRPSPTAPRPSRPSPRASRVAPPQASLERELIGVKSELRKKEKQLEESREENLRLKMEAGRTRDGSPGFGGQSSRGDSPSSSGSGAGSELDRNQAGEPERGGSDDEKDALSKALAENASLKKFLRDYGMTWVGDESSADASVGARGDETGPDDDFGARRGKKVRSSRLKARAEAARANKHSADAVLGPTGANANAPAIPGRVAATNATTTEPFSVFAVDVEKLLASIAELNAVAGDGKSSVVVGANGERRLEAPNAKTLTLFRDGFVVDDAPKTFRSFAEETNRSYVRDLVDGFFPYEYKEAHPSGVPFKLVDKSLENGAPADAFVAFTGGGARLDGKASKETSGQFLREIKKNRNRTGTERMFRSWRSSRASWCATARWCTSARASVRRCAVEAWDPRRRRRRPSSRQPSRAGVSARSSSGRGFVLPRTAEFSTTRPSSVRPTTRMSLTSRRARRSA